MTRERRERRRATFDQPADLDDRARPGYPRRCSTPWPPSPRASSPAPQGRDPHGRVRGLASAHHIAGGELDQSRRFGPTRFRRYQWELPYTTASYLDLLRTYSGHPDLDPEAQSGLLGCIARLIDGRYDGRIAKRYLTELRVAATVQPSSRPRAPGSVRKDLQALGRFRGPAS